MKLYNVNNLFVCAYCILNISQNIRPYIINFNLTKVFINITRLFKNTTQILKKVTMPNESYPLCDLYQAKTAKKTPKTEALEVLVSH